MRREDWPTVLDGEIGAARAGVFEWGVKDCATWAFDVRRAMTGIDDAVHWRGKYKTAKGAARQILRLGFADLREGATFYLGPPLATAFLAQRGDVVFARDALGLCIGATAIFIAPEGCTEIPLGECLAAWRVA